MNETTNSDSISRTAYSGVPRLGIVGGGQLARMTSMAAMRLGCEVVVLERYPLSPATQCATRSVVGDWNDPAELLALAARVDVASIENEFVEIDALEAIEKGGHRLYPTTSTLRLIQDKLIQKQTLAKAGLFTPKFREVSNTEAVSRVAQEFGWPIV